jgi:nickel-dependent lactate racemase
MADAARLARLDFALNVVIGRSLRTLAVAAGEPLAVQTELADFIRGYAEVALPGDVEAPGEAPDLVVTGPGRPLDVNLYQTVKALVGIEPLAGPDTVVLVVSACSDGIGGQEWPLPFVGAASPDAMLKRLEDEYTVEKDHSYFVARFLQRCPQVVACCPGVADKDLRGMFLDPVRDVTEGLGRALQLLRSRRARPYVLLFPQPQRALLPAPGSPT